ncbi:putative heme oxygenase [Magnetospirillum sp. XM-1]|uniref:biliverdin-producing heme oxygenase n=1 Tax=Magnetospirillum sp. XM-1 TaxID=1663591 RepID=UPI00073E07A8|nr:biliverdin-producing heme oxygenase [Magnetospirillum sp. XM-1]CUW41253.1 putative heme oxygenase [Magnetospirillum sp. XM-1]
MSIGGVWRALRAATAPMHAELEAVPINRRLFSDDFSTAELGELLGRFVTIYRPLEATLMNAEPTRSLHYMQRLPLLLKGLEALKCEVPQHDIPAPILADIPSRIGALYVVEGSTMGGQLIHRHLIFKYPPEALGFFLPHGEKTAERWRHFLAEMETCLVHSEALDSAKFGAIDTFRVFHRALTA